MGWETRNGGGLYYTRSRRINGRVVREYIGSGPLAETISKLDALDREQRQKNREKFKIEKKIQLTIDRKISKETDMVKTLTKAILLINGYHNHKGQWRKRRDD